MAICLQARYVFPVESPPIEGGAVTVHDDRVADVGRTAAGVKTVDLGNVAILPGLVNAHTHLEFSDRVSPMDGKPACFTSWLQAVIQHRRDPAGGNAGNWLKAVRRGLAECTDAGTSLIGEIATSDWTVDPPRLGPIDGVVFRELIGSRAERLDSRLAIARRHIAAGQQPATSWRAGISPHSPYTTNVPMIQRVAKLSAETRTPVAMHLAESTEEIELLSAHSGPLVSLLADWDAWDPSAVPRGIEVIDYLRLLDRAHRVLVVHGNYLTRGPWDFLADRSDHMSVVYCPRTHAYFGHTLYPLGEMLKRGVQVCLGTDSRASNPDLNLFHEIQHVADHHPDVSPADILRLGTLAGARALGYGHELGSISTGKRANLIVLPLPEDRSSEPHELLLRSPETPHWIMRNGQMIRSA